MYFFLSSFKGRRKFGFKERKEIYKTLFLSPACQMMLTRHCPFSLRHKCLKLLFLLLTIALTDNSLLWWQDTWVSKHVSVVIQAHFMGMPAKQELDCQLHPSKRFSVLRTDDRFQLLSHSCLNWILKSGSYY